MTYKSAPLSKDEKVFIIECESLLMPGKAIHAQLCKFPETILDEISNAIEADRTSVAKTTFAVGDAVCAPLGADGYKCRAQVVEVYDTDCLLDFVDSGTVRKQPKREIFTLSQEIINRWERVAIHILLKDEMQVYVNAAALLSCIDVIEIGNNRYYHGKLTDFSEYGEDSKLFPVHRYIPPAPVVVEQPVPRAIEVNLNGHVVAGGPRNADPHRHRVKIPMPKVNDMEEVVTVVDMDDNKSYVVQLKRLNASDLQHDIQHYYGAPEKQVRATDVEEGCYVIVLQDALIHRALVLSVEDGEACLLSTDYGCEIITPVENLMELRPGPVADYPWVTVTVESDDKLVKDEEVLLRLEPAYTDDYGVPVYKAGIILVGKAEDRNNGPVAKFEQPPRSTFRELEIDPEDQTLYFMKKDNQFLAAQLGQYTVEELFDMNKKLKDTIVENGLLEDSSKVFAAGDYVAIREDGDPVAFYRGIVSKVEGATVWVYQVDFGDLIESEMTKLRVLPEQFINLPVIGIRCELSRAQLMHQWEESFDVRNLRKKACDNFVDLYEFDLIPVENGVAGAHVENHKVEEPKTTQSEAAGTQEHASVVAGSQISEGTKPEEQTPKSAESTDLNHNITGCEKLKHLLESTAVEAVDIPEPEMKRGLDPASRDSESRVPFAEVNLCEAIPSGPENGTISPILFVPASVEKAIAQPNARGDSARKPESPVKEFTYEFATVVKYPDFQQVPERVRVSQITDSSLMVQLSRFDLDHLQAIDNEIRTFLAQHPNIDPTPLSVGNLVIFVRDDYCRRAEIIEQVRDEFRIACIDYGCTFLAPKSQLVRLPKVFEKYARCAVTIEGKFTFKQGQDIDLMLSVQDGKVFVKPTPSVSPPSVWNEHNYSESVRSCSVSVLSDTADDDDLDSARDPEDPCADKSIDVVVTSVHRATKVCVVKSRLLSLSKAVGENLKSQAESLKPAILENLEMGSVVVVKLMTDPPRFRRAKVAHYDRSTELFKLFLVDSGLMVKAPLSNMFELPAAFSLERTPSYATILRLKADDLAYDSKVVSEVFGGTLRCSLSYSHPDDLIPGELCHEATLYNKSGNVIRQLNSKGIVSTRVDRLLPNPVMLPCTADAEYMDAIVVAAQETEPSTFSITLLLFELKERLDRTTIETDQLKNLYAMKLGAPALAFLENDPSPWKRARVIGRPLPGKYKLLLVDVGLEIIHPVLKTYKCPTNLLHIPEVAVGVTITSQKKITASELHDRLVVVKTRWDISYTSKVPTVELYDHDGNLLLP